MQYIKGTKHSKLPLSSCMFMQEAVAISGLLDLPVRSSRELSCSYSRQVYTLAHAFTLPIHVARTYSVQVCSSGRSLLHKHAGAERAEALLTTSAEDCLKAAVYDGAYSGSGRAGPAQVILGFLQQPFTDLRVATYRSKPFPYCSRCTCPAVSVWLC